MVRRDRPALRRSRLLASAAALLMVGAATLLLPSPASADVTEVGGGAFGYSVANVVIFGGAQSARGPEPAVTLAANASNSPQSASAGTASVAFGPANLFSSGPLTVSSEGSLGPGGSVRSSAEIDRVNTSGQELFTASRVQSACNASESAVNGSTTIGGGNVQTSEGDPDVEGDEVIVPVPDNPPPNTTIEGTIEGVGDRFRYVFNQQSRSGNGITVNAVHLQMLGPTATGEVIIGQSRCSVSAGAPAAAQAPATTRAPGAATTTTVRPGGGGQGRSGGQSGPGPTTGGSGMATTGSDVLPLAIMATACVIAGAILTLERRHLLAVGDQRRRRRP